MRLNVKITLTACKMNLMVGRSQQKQSQPLEKSDQQNSIDIYIAGYSDMKISDEGKELEYLFLKYL